MQHAVPFVELLNHSYNRLIKLHILDKFICPHRGCIINQLANSANLDQLDHRSSLNLFG